MLKIRILADFQLGSFSGEKLHLKHENSSIRAA